MLIFSIIFILLSNAVTLRRDKLILFSRVVIIALFYSWVLVIPNTFSSLNNGIKLFVGLLFTTNIITYLQLFSYLFLCLVFLYKKRYFILNILKQIFLGTLCYIYIYPLITFRISLFILLYVSANDMLFDNILLSSSGNQPPMGGNSFPPTGGNPQPPMGGGNPLPPLAPAPPRGATAMPSVFLDQDVEPIQAQRLRTVHSKLSQLSIAVENTSPNKGLTMNSSRLINLEFTRVDRSTMENHIVNVYPNMYHRFRTTQQGFTYSGPMTSEILGLFKPDTLA
jgi:hypothetical protein